MSVSITASCMASASASRPCCPSVTARLLRAARVSKCSSQQALARLDHAFFEELRLLQLALLAQRGGQIELAGQRIRMILAEAALAQGQRFFQQASACRSLPSRRYSSPSRLRSRASDCGMARAPPPPSSSARRAALIEASR
jgi:hypothetical protein